MYAEHNETEIPYKWEKLIEHSDVKKLEFSRKYFKFSNGLKSEILTIREIYNNADPNYNEFYSLVVMFLLTFEIARRINPPGKYPFTQQEVETTIQTVFDPAIYEGADSQQTYNDLVSHFAFNTLQTWTMVI